MLDAEVRDSRVTPFLAVQARHAQALDEALAQQQESLAAAQVHSLLHNMICPEDDGSIHASFVVQGPSDVCLAIG